MLREVIDVYSSTHPDVYYHIYKIYCQTFRPKNNLTSNISIVIFLNSTFNITTPRNKKAKWCLSYKYIYYYRYVQSLDNLNISPMKSIDNVYDLAHGDSLCIFKIPQRVFAHNSVH